jgi:2-haloacid dehalogenase
VRCLPPSQAKSNVASRVKALFFDVFGTLTDWRRSVAREAQCLLEPLGYTVDWIAFAVAWRSQYQPAMEEIRSGRADYTRLDILHRRMLQNVLPRFGLDKLHEAELDQLNLAWHRLDVWPDVQAGLEILRQRFLIAPVSNGNISLMADIARRNDLRWDAILGADLARDFKPKAAVYLAAVEAFGLEPGQCMMCAAHDSDLAAAAAVGLRTAFIARPEEQPDQSENASGVGADYSVQSLTDLAAQLSTRVAADRPVDLT